VGSRRCDVHHDGLFAREDGLDDVPGRVVEPSGSPELDEDELRVVVLRAFSIVRMMCRAETP
jgi:hypothetical protein